ncbi:MAG TPA: tRNA glutamyl-Q(34) synthetase GluQRS [Pseudomonadales bacterium]
MTAGPGGGRFAPSPTGPLHLGSLLAATASWLDARRLGMPWRVRFDDLDAPRNMPGAERSILLALERHALHWDGPVERQSERLDDYRHALAMLDARGELFYCRCTRSELKGFRVYPGTCRDQREPRPDRAARIRVDDAAVEFDDLIQGPQRQSLADAPGDFVVRRRDGIIAYHLATAVDDGAPGIARVIRGRDLLPATGPQLFLMQRLGLNPPVYGHLPLIRSQNGQKLSKQNLAPALDNTRAAENLARVLTLLGLDPGPHAEQREPADLLAEAVPRFSPATVSKHDGFVTISRHDPGTHRRA